LDDFDFEDDRDVHKRVVDPWVKAKHLREYHEDFLRKYHGWTSDDDEDAKKKEIV
jgi:hypothetical protein